MGTPVHTAVPSAEGDEHPLVAALSIFAPGALRVLGGAGSAREPAEWPTPLPGRQVARRRTRLRATR
ncbi:hypothetical protein F4556_004005 [Kitasatospora gansuensis]|uniref:Uncharacterized protein n=1 Tax=Kitasatospora gansuensis TaxID=258050 RepID=A0A7W7SDJ5_9ACTN|nr:hypothetical protein [Kitasatospora gansuensis]MBB4948470.1 hypothetical protein [Kitasatospora gansuensis]